MTYWGTNTYLLGNGSGLCIIDPGPESSAHLGALLDAIGTAQVSHIVVTHSHLDHSPLAARLSALTGAPVIGYGPYDAGRSPIMQQLIDAGLDSGGEGLDRTFTPDLTVKDGEIIRGSDWNMRVLHTPGHLGNHICLRWNDAIFTGDHVMGWSSSLVSPPDGDLTDFMKSCQKLTKHKVDQFLPGHGPPVTNPAARLEWLIGHRLAREAQILAALSSQAKGLTLTALTRMVYDDTPTHLHMAAARNVLAHLVDLSGRNMAGFSQPIREETLFRVI